MPQPETTVYYIPEPGSMLILVCIEGSEDGKTGNGVASAIIGR
jgi:hypothetical protein